MYKLDSHVIWMILAGVLNGYTAHVRSVNNRTGILIVQTG